MISPCLLLAASVLAGSQLEASRVSAAPSIPIDGPVIITESGDYVITQDFTASGIAAIRLSGQVDADIDLAGHTIGATGAPVIQFRIYPDDTSPRRLTLHGGTVKAAGGDASGIFAFPYRSAAGYLTIDRMVFDHAGIHVEDVATSVTSSRFLGAAVNIDNDFGRGSARFEGNEIAGADLRLPGVPGLIVGNRIQGSIRTDGSDGFSSSPAIRDNVVTGNILVGVVGTDGTSRVEIGRNRVGGYICLNQGNQPWVYRNVIEGCSPSGVAIQVDYVRLGSIEDNTFNGRCEHGIVFGDLSTGNVYGGNVFRTYVPVPIVDEGRDNRDDSIRLGPESLE